MLAAHARGRFNIVPGLYLHNDSLCRHNHRHGGSIGCGGEGAMLGEGERASALAAPTCVS